jgi:hypothetical protein
VPALLDLRNLRIVEIDVEGDDLDPLVESLLYDVAERFQQPVIDDDTAEALASSVARSWVGARQLPCRSAGANATIRTLQTSTMPVQKTRSATAQNQKVSWQIYQGLLTCSAPLRLLASYVHSAYVLAQGTSLQAYFR